MRESWIPSGQILLSVMRTTWLQAHFTVREDLSGLDWNGTHFALTANTTMKSKWHLPQRKLLTKGSQAATKIKERIDANYQPLV